MARSTLVGIEQSAITFNPGLPVRSQTPAHAVEQKRDESRVSAVSSGSLPKRLQDDPFPSLTVELRVIDLLPRAKVEPPVGDWHYDLMVD